MALIEYLLLGSTLGLAAIVVLTQVVPQLSVVIVDLFHLGGIGH